MILSLLRVLGGDQSIVDWIKSVKVSETVGLAASRHMPRAAVV